MNWVESQWEWLVNNDNIDDDDGSHLGDDDDEDACRVSEE